MSSDIPNQPGALWHRLYMHSTLVMIHYGSSNISRVMGHQKSKYFWSLMIRYYLWNMKTIPFSGSVFQVLFFWKDILNTDALGKHILTIQQNTGRKGDRYIYSKLIGHQCWTLIYKRLNECKNYPFGFLTTLNSPFTEHSNKRTLLISGQFIFPW